jgi:hypothetical protein
MLSENSMRMGIFEKVGGFLFFAASQLLPHVERSELLTKSMRDFPEQEQTYPAVQLLQKYCISFKEKKMSF